MIQLFLHIFPLQYRIHIETLPDDSNKSANLQKLLRVAVGMIYDIAVNVNVEDGLTNGLQVMSNSLKTQIVTVLYGFCFKICKLAS